MYDRPVNALELLGTIQAMDLDLDKLRLDEDSIPGELKAARDDKIRLNGKLEKLRQEHLAVRRKLSEAEHTAMAADRKAIGEKRRQEAL